MGRKIKIKMAILAISMLFLLVGCFPTGELALPAFDPNTFSREIDLNIDSELDGLVIMQVDVLFEAQTLVITVRNETDHEINIGSQSESRISHPGVQFFDGAYWRRIPRLGPFDIEEYDLEGRLQPGEEQQINLNLENYRFDNIPENSLFRILLTARGYDPTRGIGTAAQFRHHFFAEFTFE